MTRRGNFCPKCNKWAVVILTPEPRHDRCKTPTVRVTQLPIHGDEFSGFRTNAITGRTPL